MTEQEDNINLGKNVCEDNNQEKNRWFVWDKPVPGLCVSFCPNFL